MADIELVIKIPEDEYKIINEIIKKSNTPMTRVEHLIANGKPLPKGHGRLIDADALEEKLHRYTEAPYQYALTVFNESPTIIEAAKESEENK